MTFAMNSSTEFRPPADAPMTTMYFGPGIFWLRQCSNHQAPSLRRLCLPLRFGHYQQDCFAGNLIVVSNLAVGISDKSIESWLICFKVTPLNVCRSPLVINNKVGINALKMRCGTAFLKKVCIMEENPILIVDDDQEDLDLIKDVAEYLKLKRPIHYFNNGDGLAEYLQSLAKPPFLIICDVNLPEEDGFAIKKRISEDPELKYKSVPFIYWSTDASEKQIQHAYDLPAQGFFFKPSNFNELCDTFETILRYWQKSQHPKRLK